MNECDEIQPKLILYVLGDLEWGEHKTVRRHVEQCESCAREARLAVELWDAASLACVPPSPEFYERCRAAVRAARARGATRQRYRVLWWILALAAAIAVAVGLRWWDSGSTTPPELPGSSVAGSQEDLLPMPQSGPVATAPDETLGMETAGANASPGATRETELRSGQFAGAASRPNTGKRRVSMLTAPNEARKKMPSAEEDPTPRRVQAMAIRREPPGDALATVRETMLELNRSAERGKSDVSEVLARARRVTASPNVSDEMKCEAWYLISRIHGSQGELALQREAFEKYLDYKGASDGSEGRVLAALGEGRRLTASKEYARGIEYYRRALREEPEPKMKAFLLCKIGENLEKLGDLDRALELYRYVHTTFPEMPAGTTALMRMPRVYVNMNRAEDAITAYEYCISKLEDKDAKARCLLQAGVLQELLGVHDQKRLLSSITCYQNVVKEYPETACAKEAQERLSALAVSILRSGP